MRLLLVHPGPSYSTHDVWDGIREGLRALGHTVFEYEISGRARASAEALRVLHAETGFPPPTRSDVLYHAGHAAYAMCLRHAIEAVIIVTAEHWHPDHTTLIRRAGLPVGVVFTESPYQDEIHACNLSLATHVWTNDVLSVDDLNEAFGHLEAPARAYYLPAAYSRRRVQAAADLADGVRKHDVVFVGSGFRERIRLLEAVDWSGIDLGLYGSWDLLMPEWARRAVRRRDVPIPALRALFGHWPGGSPLWRHLQGGIISNDLALALYRRAAIGVNLFRSSVVYSRRVTSTRDAYSLGPRLYELAASGTFTISEHRPEIEEVFGDLIPTFRTPEEMGALIRHWLPLTEERRQIALRVQERVAEHSYDARAMTLIRDLTG